MSKRRSHPTASAVRTLVCALAVSACAGTGGEPAQRLGIPGTHAPAGIELIGKRGDYYLDVLVSTGGNSWRFFLPQSEDCQAIVSQSEGLRYAQSGFGLKEDLSGLTETSGAYAAAMARSGINAFGQWAWRNKTSIWNLDFGSPGYRPSPQNEIRAKAMAEAVKHCHDAGMKWFIVYGIWQVFSDWPDVGTIWLEQSRC